MSCLSYFWLCIELLAFFFLLLFLAWLRVWKPTRRRQRIRFCCHADSYFDTCRLLTFFPAVPITAIHPGFPKAPGRLLELLQRPACAVTSPTALFGGTPHPKRGALGQSAVHPSSCCQSVPAVPYRWYVSFRLFSRLSLAASPAAALGAVCPASSCVAQTSSYSLANLCVSWPASIGTPADPMSLSRSPSPVPGGGWSSPGLNMNSGRTSPANAGGSSVSWESAKMRKHGANGYPSFSTQNQGFFTRHMRRISSSLPRFNSGIGNTHAEREKYEREGYNAAASGGRIRSFFARVNRRLKWKILLPLIIFCTIVIYYGTRKWNDDIHLNLWYFWVQLG